ncbi:MAG: hypothetical protein IAE82_10750 [Opitutaceae bacterium]|nr:hypothetical protein [Opitutaceae bacterium]
MKTTPLFRILPTALACLLGTAPLIADEPVEAGAGEPTEAADVPISSIPLSKIAFTPAQRTEIFALLRRHREEVEALQAETNLSTDAKLAKVKESADRALAQIRALMNREQQRSFDLLYDAARREARERAKRQGIQ